MVIYKGRREGRRKGGKEGRKKGRREERFIVGGKQGEGEKPRGGGAGVGVLNNKIMRERKERGREEWRERETTGKRR